MPKLPLLDSRSYARFLNRKFILFLSLFLFSGFAGLIYEVVWERILQLYFGVNSLSVALIVSAYMLGLGLGSLLGGRLSQFVKRHLLVYGLLEGGIALMGLLSPAYLVWMGERTAGSPLSIVFILSFASLLIPTLLMGATLPILSQAFIEKVSLSGTIISILYAINTLGAAFGALTSGFALIGRLGLNGTVYFAVALNTTISLVAILASLRTAQSARPVEAAADESTDLLADPLPQPETRWGYPQTVLSAFLIGFIDLAFQMLWYRVLSITNKSTAYIFPVLLFVFLLGLAAGSYVLGRLVDRQKNRVVYFVQLQMIIALVVTVSLLAFYVLLETPYQQLFRDTFSEVRQPLTPFVLLGGAYAFSEKAAVLSLLKFLILPVLLVLPASFIMGGGLPILDRIVIDRVQSAGRKIGDVYVANILGSVTGTLAIPLVLFDRLGSEGSLRFLVACSLIFPLLYVLSRPRGRALGQWLSKQKTVLGLAALVLLPVLLLPGQHWLYAQIIKKGAGASAVIQEVQDAVFLLTDTSPAFLFINGEAHSFFPSFMAYEGDAVLCAGAATPQRILVIGLGGGHTVSVLAQTPGVEEITVVELLHGLRPFVEAQFDFLGPVLSDPKVKYLVDDGRRYLYANPAARYDMIIIDPQWTSSAGSNNLYSREALRLYQQHLSDEGVLCAWTNEFSVMPTTFASVFPYQDQLGEELVAKNTPIRYDYEAMQRHQAQFLASPHKNVAGSGQLLLDPAWLLSHFDRDRADLLSSQNNAPALSDFTPYLEYYFFYQPNPLIPGPARPDPLGNILARVDGCTGDCETKITVAYLAHNAETAPLASILTPCQPNDRQKADGKQVSAYLPLNDGQWWVVSKNSNLEMWNTDPQAYCR